MIDVSKNDVNSELMKKKNVSIITYHVNKFWEKVVKTFIIMDKDFLHTSVQELLQTELGGNNLPWHLS